MIDVQAGVVGGYKGIKVPFAIRSKGEASNQLAIMLPGSGKHS